MLFDLHPSANFVPDHGHEVADDKFAHYRVAVRFRYKTAGPASSNGDMNLGSPTLSTVTCPSTCVSRRSTLNHSTTYVPGSNFAVNGSAVLLDGSFSSFLF